MKVLSGFSFIAEALCRAGRDFDLELLPLRVLAAVAGLFLFLAPMSEESFYRMKTFSTRYRHFAQVKKRLANLFPLIPTVFQQFSEKECGKQPRRLKYAAQACVF
jgi:hypothetical protein